MAVTFYHCHRVHATDRHMYGQNYDEQPVKIPRAPVNPFMMLSGPEPNRSGEKLVKTKSHYDVHNVKCSQINIQESKDNYITITRSIHCLGIEFRSDLRYDMT